MGEKSIAILPKPSDSTPLSSNALLYANFGKVAAKAEETIDRFDLWFKDNGPILSHAAAAIGGAAQSFDSLLAQVHETSEPSGRVKTGE